MERSRTDFERVATAYSQPNKETMDVLEEMDTDELRELQRTLAGVHNSIDILLEKQN